MGPGGLAVAHPLYATEVFFMQALFNFICLRPVRSGGTRAEGSRGFPQARAGDLECKYEARPLGHCRYVERARLVYSAGETASGGGGFLQSIIENQGGEDGDRQHRSCHNVERAAPMCSRGGTAGKSAGFLQTSA